MLLARPPPDVAVREFNMRPCFGNVNDESTRYCVTQLGQSQYVDACGNPRKLRTCGQLRRLDPSEGTIRARAESSRTPQRTRQEGGCLSTASRGAQVGLQGIGCPPAECRRNEVDPIQSNGGASDVPAFSGLIPRRCPRQWETGVATVHAVMHGA